jgi:hypothetical protein
MPKDKEQAPKDREIRESLARTKEWMTDQSQRAIKLRSKDREFHGLDRELIDYQNELITDYEKSKDVKHPRDLGDIREALLRKFLVDTGLLPKRYAVSERRIRVASTSGHLSKEMDLAIYDPVDSVSLMKQGEVYEVLPVESIYGVVQIKSKLTKTEIENGLSNIASFKRLQRQKEQQQTSGFFYNDPNKIDSGFGLLFAYDSDMEWLDIVKEIENFGASHEAKELANAVFILKKGFFLHGQDHPVNPSVCITNPDLSKITKIYMHGQPDHEGLCLWHFYQMLLQLLRTTTISTPFPENYFRLPLVSGADSYHFQLGYHSEVSKCAKHGDYQRKISPAQLQKVKDWCSANPKIDIIAEEDKIYKRPPGLPQPKVRHYFVHVYNPDNFPLKDVLTIPQILQGREVLGVGYEPIIVGEMEIYIPHFYSYRDEIISNCPKCPKPKKLVSSAPETE